MTGLVVDASITLAWLFEDEQTPAVLEVQDAVAADGAVAPAHWPLEVANALLMAERRGRITADYRIASLNDLALLPIAIDTETADRAWRETVRLAEAYRLTAYDAAYLELASRLGQPLATLDDDLRAAAVRVGLPLVGR